MILTELHQYIDNHRVAARNELARSKFGIVKTVLMHDAECMG